MTRSRPPRPVKRSRSLGTLPDTAPEHAGGKGSRGPRAYELLREAIATGRLRPGSRVLESELANLLHMSRTPVREAIAALEAEGLVTVDGTRGRVVTKLDYQSIIELHAVREVLESAAAGMAARNASDIEILALGEMIEMEARILDDPARLRDHRRRFHEAIYHCSHNRYIVKMLQYIQTGLLLLEPVDRTTLEGREAVLKDHRAIVEAIQARDPAAAEGALRNDVRRTQQARLRAMLENR